MRVKSVWERVRSVLEGGAVAEEPRWTGGGGCRRVRDTDLPLRPCDLWHLGAWAVLWEDMHDRSGQGRRSSPSAARGTSVYPNAIHPEGYKQCTGFTTDPWPTWTYDCHGTVVQ